MESTTQMRLLLGFADALAGTHSRDLVLAAALPALLPLVGAGAVLARTTPDRSDSTAGPGGAVARSGLDLDPGAMAELVGDPSTASQTLTAHAVPRAWADVGITVVASHVLDAGTGTLVVAWMTAPSDTEALEAALSLLDAALTRAEAEEGLVDLAARVDKAQQLADMGDYDWHIPTNTNRWSDQLFRIYGHEPQSFNPSYEKFLSLIHEEDRESITALHRHAYATGEPYRMIERIVRPDGTVRYLSSNGEVILDADHQPVRMRGTCIDITERVLADRDRDRIAARFQGLVDSAPDAILLLGAEQCVLEANQRALELLGGNPQGMDVQALLPGWSGSGASGLTASSLDGRTIQLDVVRMPVDPAQDAASGEDSLVALFLRDAAPRLEGEAVAARLGQAQLRRRQALEINDNVVQGLVAAVYALDLGQVGASMSYLDRTLTAARAMMDDLLDPLDGMGLQPGDLVRTAPAHIGAHPDPGPGSRVPEIEPQISHRILVVDDAEELRMLLCTRIESCDGLAVVGEAADGLAAVKMAAELQPDLVLLDLAMPRMDGLEALPLIREAVPGVRVIVLSGFNQSTLAQKALEAGADHYVVKGGSMTRLLELVDSLLAPVSRARGWSASANGDTVCT